MTKAEQLLRDRIRRRANAATPDLIKQELKALDIIKATLNERELERAIADGTIERLLDDLFSDRNLDQSLSRLREHINQLITNESISATARLPFPNLAFNALSPNVTRAIADLQTRVINGMREDIRAGVKEYARAGMDAGQGPRVIARGLRETVGLAPNQEDAIRNFERMLREGDREALTRVLRDKRFDRALRKALGKGGTGLTDEQIAKMSAAYRKRMVAFNAETHARTVALDSERLAHRLSWENAIAEGYVDRNQLERTWIAVGGPTGDGRNRPEHLELHGTTVAWDQPYPNGEMVPGESTYNCRCVEKITVKRPQLAVA